MIKRKSRFSEEKRLFKCYRREFYFIDYEDITKKIKRIQGDFIGVLLEFTALACLKGAPVVLDTLSRVCNFTYPFIFWMTLQFVYLHRQF